MLLVQGLNLAAVALSSAGQDTHPILLMVMGAAKYFTYWHEELRSAPCDFLYASYDSDINMDNTMFIPGTTWTEGRNLLAAEALRREHNRLPYQFWGFADEDVVVKCAQNKTKQNTHPFPPDGCLAHLIRILTMSGAMPDRAMALALHNEPKRDLAVTTPDADFNIFRRSFVPFVLPYATLPKSRTLLQTIQVFHHPHLPLKTKCSQWTSQAVLFAIMHVCGKSGFYSPAGFYLENTRHAKYAHGIKRKLSVTAIRNTLSSNYRYVDQNADGPAVLPLLLGLFANGDIKAARQNLGMKTAGNVTELNRLLPIRDLANSPCVNLVDRFVEWRRSLRLSS